MNWFLLLKSLHVLSAIVAVGANATYGIWSAFGKRSGTELGFALRGIKVVDDRMANPAYGVLLVTGLIMAFTTYDIVRTFILIGLGIFFIAAVGGQLYSATVAKQIQALDRSGAQSPEYAALDARARGIGIFLAVVLVAVVFVMVFKPQV